MTDKDYMNLRTIQRHINSIYRNCNEEEIRMIKRSLGYDRPEYKELKKEYWPNGYRYEQYDV